ncbi:MAG: cob(I)yrinic acid a,c-diamide adenosyltransferase [Chitinispirillales bacterium]|jgi:cob(I)alamin adenosyltransferase|nr:cob(I)yrinic acid a,c-diamide adenosyltransferase [Chitinispirillales bacterium]
MNGYIQVYTGNGKGKTTAALGAALRAVGAGMKVFIAQFVKGREYCEIFAARNFLPAVTIKQYGLDFFITHVPTQADVDIAVKGLKEISKIILSNEYDMVILDEANIAVYYNLFTSTQLISILKNKPETLEIIITGRYACPEILEIADLVTEMKEVKHYYTQGVKARKGIEC